ncbi:unnamed protein product [Gadus morhua 'NCC']
MWKCYHKDFIWCFVAHTYQIPTLSPSQGHNPHPDCQPVPWSTKIQVEVLLRRTLVLGTLLLQTVDSAGCCWSHCARPLLSSLWSSTSSAVTWFVPENPLASLRKTDLYYRNMRMKTIAVYFML